MQRFQKVLLLAISACLFLVDLAPADAQLFRRFRWSEPVEVPYVDLNVAAPGLVLRGPYAGRVLLGRRRRALLAPDYAELQADDRSGVQQAYYAGPNLAPANLPSYEELASMDYQSLHQTLLQLSSRLHERLTRFDTGEGWQEYLSLPEEMYDDSQLQLDVLAERLTRFNSVAENPQFEMIAELPTFAATQSALQQMVVRFTRPRVIELQRTARRRVPHDSRADERRDAREPQAEEVSPRMTSPDTGKEVMPTPAPLPNPQARRGEHSILRSPQ